MWSSLVLVLILLSYFFLLLVPIHHAELSQEEIKGYTDYLSQGLAQKGTLTTPDKVESVVYEAHELSVELYGNSAAMRSRFMGKLLPIYAQAANEDVVIIATPGGWGVDAVTEGGQWWPVVEGMRSTLEGWGYSPVIVDYLRMTTRADTSAYFREIQDLFRFYGVTANELAAIVKFLVEDNPEVKIIITGLSHGAAYTDAVIKRLYSEPQVLEHVVGIEGGPPWYHFCLQSDRAFVTRSNGIVPDNWSQGNRALIFRKTITGTVEWLADKTPWFANEQRRIEKHNRHAYYIQTPGHDYGWYPEFSFLVTGFLQPHFSPQV